MLGHYIITYVRPWSVHSMKYLLRAVMTSVRLGHNVSQSYEGAIYLVQPKRVGQSSVQYTSAIEWDVLRCTRCERTEPKLSCYWFHFRRVKKCSRRNNSNKYTVVLVCWTERGVTLLHRWDQALPRLNKRNSMALAVRIEENLPGTFSFTLHHSILQMFIYIYIYIYIYIIYIYIYIYTLLVFFSSEIHCSCLNLPKLNLKNRPSANNRSCAVW